MTNVHLVTEGKHYQWLLPNNVPSKYYKKHVSFLYTKNNGYMAVEGPQQIV